MVAIEEEGSDRSLGTEPLPRVRGGPEFAFELRVIEGPSAGELLHIQGAGTRYLVGTSAACALRIVDPAVSRRHCALRIESGALRVEDVGSTNGLFIGSVRVLAAEVSDRTRMRVGASVLEVVRVEPAAVPTTRQASFGRLVGASAAMRRLHPVLAAVASSDAPVLIEGETGTGKELLAEVLHEEGPRSATPFNALAGNAQPTPLRLFGLAGQPGLLETEGTVFVRDVCALPFDSQRTLGQLLSRQPAFRTDGSPFGMPRARFIASSRRDPDLEVQRGRFDESLASVLGRVRIELPPLRMRDGDVRLLTEFFWRKLETGDRVVSVEEMARLEAHRWYGNVRELEAAVAHLAGGSSELSDEAELRGASDAPIGEVAERLLNADLPLVQARTWLGEEFDRRYLQKILAMHDGNVSRAAAASGVARRYFQLLKTKHGIRQGEK